jgi:hypothetical protein
VHIVDGRNGNLVLAGSISAAVRVAFQLAAGVRLGNRASGCFTADQRQQQWCIDFMSAMAIWYLLEASRQQYYA